MTLIELKLLDSDYFEDYFDHSLAEAVLEAVAQFPDWELETIIAAEAAYAENFLSRN
jgi:hypothetical protein